MSLILDALRKADAERERGSVPSLHSHPVAPLAAEKPAAARTRASWPWAALAIGVGLAATGTWLVATRPAPPATVQPPPMAAPQAPVTSPAQRPSAASAPPSAPVAPPAAAVAAPPVAPPVAEPAPWPQPEERKAAPDGGGGPPVAYLGNVPPAVEPPVYSREQLPADVRAALPPITIGGSIYSPKPADRSLIVNGQLFRERDRLTADLSLEEIRLKSAVFGFRGYRFEVLF